MGKGERGAFEPEPQLCMWSWGPGQVPLTEGGDLASLHVKNLFD